MTYTGVTRLRLNSETGEAKMGSGEVVSKRAEDGTSYGGYSAADLQGITPFSNYDEFIEATKSEQYKGNWQTAREAEAYRELCAKRLAAMDMKSLTGRAQSEPQDTASAIVQADPSINPVIAQRAVQAGGFATREERQSAYANPLYKTSEDYRSQVAARDALTEF